MTDRVTNELIYETLKSMQQVLSKLQTDALEVKECLGHVETNVGGLAAQYATLSTRLDRIDLRLERVEKRLDLVEG